MHNAGLVAIGCFTKGWNLLKLLKIVFNLSGTARLLTVFATFLIAPSSINLQHCNAICYSEAISTFIYREALAAFLLLRISKLANTSFDNGLSVALLIVRTVFQVGGESLNQIQITQNISNYFFLNRVWTLQPSSHN